MNERETWKETLSVEVYTAMERLAMSLPESWGRKVFGAGAAAAFHLASTARRTVARNLARVTGRPPDSPIVQAATLETFRSYARYWHETFLIRRLPREEFLRRYEMKGREHLEAAQDVGHGGIVALPHLGNWDAAGRYVAEQGWGITAVAEELKPARMYTLFERHRKDLGMGIVPLSESRKVAQDLLQLLAGNEFIALVCDRDLKGTGVDVEMFGRRRKMPAGPALLSLASGSPLLPCACYRTEDGWGAVIHPPLEIERTGVMREDVTRMTQALAEQFERDIAATPIEWHMFQPAWDDA